MAAREPFGRSSVMSEPAEYMYDNFAFGGGNMAWIGPAGLTGASMEELQSTETLHSEPARDAVIGWLREGHNRFRTNLAALDDRELPTERRRPEGGTKETRWIIGVMIEHDLYHAGEINHIRALMLGNDRWAW